MAQVDLEPAARASSIAKGVIDLPRGGAILRTPRIFEARFRNPRTYDFERKKTEQEVEHFAAILEEGFRFIRLLGGNPVPVTLDHIHVIDPASLPSLAEKAQKDNKIGGRFVIEDQAALVFGGDTPIYMKAKTLAHEAIGHFQSYSSVRQVGDNIYCVQQGLRTHSPHHQLLMDEKTTENLSQAFTTLPQKATLDALDEAVTEELMIHFFEGYLREHPLFRGSIEEVAKVRRISGPNDLTQNIAFLEPIPEDTKIHYYAYKKYRQRLKNIKDLLRLAHSEIFRNDEDAFLFFAQRYLIDGDVDFPARLIDDFYGDGTFLQIAETGKIKEQ